LPATASRHISAPWFGDALDVTCSHGCAGGAPEKYSTAQPDGSAPYFCSWDPLTEWDVLGGQDLAVSYSEPDGDQVLNVFQSPSYA